MITEVFRRGNQTFACGSLPIFCSNNIISPSEKHFHFPLFHSRHKVEIVCFFLRLLFVGGSIRRLCRGEPQWFHEQLVYISKNCFDGLIFSRWITFVKHFVQEQRARIYALCGGHTYTPKPGVQIFSRCSAEFIEPQCESTRGPPVEAQRGITHSIGTPRISVHTYTPRYTPVCLHTNFEARNLARKTVW